MANQGWMAVAVLFLAITIAPFPPTLSPSAKVVSKLEADLVSAGVPAGWNYTQDLCQRPPWSTWSYKATCEVRLVDGVYIQLHIHIWDRNECDGKMCYNRPLASVMRERAYIPHPNAMSR